MRLKKVTASFLVAAMAMTILSGCGSSTTTTTTTAAASGGTSGGTTTTAAAAKETEASTEKKSFTYWIAMHAQTAQAVTDHNDHPAAIRLEEKTGVYVDFINPPVGQEIEQMNLLLASGTDMPDMIRYDLANNYRGGVEGAIADKVIMDATELIEEYAPNFMARINADEEVRKGAYTDGGSLAYFGSIIPDAEMRGLPFQGPMVNKTLLDQAGLDIPVTIADWEEMLAAFKDMGVKIPFTFGSNNKFDASYNAFSGAYGVTMGATFFNQEGTAKFSPMESGYKEFLELFAKWYANGWLDPDFLSKNQNSDVRPDFDAGIMGSAILHINSVVSAPVTSVAQGNEMNEAVPAPYPVLNEGDELHFRHYITSFNLTPTYITAEVEDPITLIEWVDFGYSDEGIEEYSWGVKDDDRFEDTFYIDENGDKQYTDWINNNPDGITPDQAYRYYMLRDVMAVWDWDNQSLMYEDERQQAGWSVWGDSADYDWVMPQTLTMTIDENDEYSKLMGDITTYVNEMSAKFVMGIESFDNYDKFIATLEKMNVARVTEIQQAALDRYLAR